MATPFATWQIHDAARVVTLDEIPKRSLQFYQGDHWQDGKGWVGPRRPEGDEGYVEELNEIERGFVSRNAIAEVVERHVQGVLGRLPHWYLAPQRPIEDGKEPSPEETALINEANALLTGWWDKRKALVYLQRALAYALNAERGAVRLYIPRGLLQELQQQPAPVVPGGNGAGGVKITARDMAQALDLVFLEAPRPDMANMVKDPDTERQAAVLVQETMGIGEGGQESREQQAEVVYLADRANSAQPLLTVIRMLTQNGRDRRITANLGGRLTIAQIQRKALINLQVHQQQTALNLAESMIPRNVVTGGFLERIFFNAMPPGYWVKDDASPGGKKFIQNPLMTGAGRNTFLQGTQYKGKEGETILANPSAQFREPIEVSAPVSAREAHYASILEETKQTHILLNDEATPSGKSREQARADYESSLFNSQEPVESVGRWLLETVLALAENFTGQEGKYTGKLRVVFECRLNTGPISVEERKQNQSEVEDGLLDQQTAMAANGVVSDVDAALARIAMQANSQLNLRKQQADIFVQLCERLPAEQAAELAGYSVEEIAAIRKAAAEKFEEEQQAEQEAVIAAEAERKRLGQPAAAAA